MMVSKTYMCLTPLWRFGLHLYLGSLRNWLVTCQSGFGSAVVGGLSLRTVILSAELAAFNFPLPLGPLTHAPTLIIIIIWLWLASSIDCLCFFRGWIPGLWLANHKRSIPHIFSSYQLAIKEMATIHLRDRNSWHRYQRWGICIDA